VRIQEPHGVTSQKTSFFIVTAAKTSNLIQFLFYFENSLSLESNVKQSDKTCSLRSAHISENSHAMASAWIGLHIEPYHFLEMDEHIKLSSQIYAAVRVCVCVCYRTHYITMELGSKVSSIVFTQTYKNMVSCSELKYFVMLDHM
jgi:hypothetical protein